MWSDLCMSMGVSPVLVRDISGCDVIVGWENRDIPIPWMDLIPMQPRSTVQLEERDAERASMHTMQSSQTAVSFLSDRRLNRWVVDVVELEGMDLTEELNRGIRYDPSLSVCRT